MQIQKRWPVLFALGSAIAYTANNYSIGGLEHLHLRPRQPGNYSIAAQSTPGIDYFPNSSLPSTSSDWRWQGAAALSDGFETFKHNVGWTENLTVGEKLAVIQDQMSKRIADLAQPSTVSQIPLANPIPAPNNLVAVNTGGNGSNDNTSAINQPIMPAVPSVRIATFNLNSFGAMQLAKPNVAEAINSILRQFDVIALQGIQSERDDILPVMVERLNQAGRRFDYLIGPRVGAGSNYQQFAFLFDTARIETDRYQLYTIEDPENLMTYDPLVAWFRCKGSNAKSAFTFSLVNLRVDRGSTNEQSIVPNIFHAIASDGRNEDDLILLGDFGGNPATIAQFNSDQIRLALRDIPTDVSGRSMSDCIVFPTQGTTEYTGRAGVYDFLRRYNLSLEQAMEISPQMPVWAEFYAVEGAHPGKVAPVSSASVF